MWAASRQGRCHFRARVQKALAGRVPTKASATETGDGGSGRQAVAGELRPCPTCGHGDVASIPLRADCHGHGLSFTRRRSVRCRSLEAYLPIPAVPSRCSETFVVLPTLDPYSHTLSRRKLVHQFPGFQGVTRETRILLEAPGGFPGCPVVKNPPCNARA